MKNKLSGAIEFLRSKEAILMVLILALFAQLPHTAVVFHRVSTAALAGLAYWGVDVGLTVDWMHSYTAAIAVEVAVLVFVVRGKSLLSWLFAACSAAMNLIYYWRPGWDIREPNPLIIGAVLWSILLPAAIAFYSHEIGDGETHKHNGNVFTRAFTRIADRLFPPRQQPVTAPVVIPVPTNGAVAIKTPKPQAVDTAANVVNGTAFDAFADVFADTTVTAMNGAIKTVVPDGITQKERVGQLDSEGFNTKQIAAQLGLSESTVRVYRMQYKKEQQETL